MVVVLCNCPPDRARDLAITLVDTGLVACVNVVEGVTSHFVWEGKREEARESTLIIKVPDLNVERARAAIVAAHPYEVPEILVLRVDSARSHPAYVAWVDGFARSG